MVGWYGVGLKGSHMVDHFPRSPGEYFRSHLAPATHYYGPKNKYHKRLADGIDYVYPSSALAKPHLVGRHPITADNMFPKRGGGGGGRGRRGPRGPRSAASKAKAAATRAHKKAFLALHGYAPPR